jgi:hypothetical protein
MGFVFCEVFVLPSLCMFFNNFASFLVELVVFILYFLSIIGPFSLPQLKPPIGGLELLWG